MTGIPRSLVLVLALIGFMAAAPVEGADHDPSALATRFQNNLLQVMKRAEILGVSGRSRELRPVITDAFHLLLMVATSTGAPWRAATPDQRARLLASYTRMSISTLASLFDDYSGETFQTVRQRQGSTRTVLVDTRILRPDDDAVNITYVTARIKGRWWIIDVILGGGISEVTVRRSEYNRLLRKAGIEGLIAALDHKSDQLIADAKKDGERPAQR